MKIKFNWGWGIAFVYGAFVVFILGVLVASRFVKVDLVDKDYYNKELAYQATINKMNRANALSEKLSIMESNGIVTLNFPKLFKNNEITGKVVFYRPSDASKDFFVKLNPNSDNLQTISLTGISKGLWKVKVDWTCSDSAYFVEHDIFVE